MWTSIIQKTRQHHWHVLFISLLVLLGIALRLHAIRVYEHDIASDELSYHAIAINILEGNPYSRDLHPPYRPEYQRTPGYPLFVAAVYAVFGYNPTAVYVVQSILNSFTILFVWILVYRLSPIYETRAAYVAAVAMVFNPMMLHSSAFLLREALSAFIVTTTIYVFYKALSDNRHMLWILSGLLIAITMWFRIEVIIGFGSSLFLYLVITLRNRTNYREIITHSIALLTPAMLFMLAPWLFYMHNHFQVYTLGIDQSFGRLKRAVALVKPGDKTDIVMLANEYGIDLANSDRTNTVYTLSDKYREYNEKDWVNALSVLRPYAEEYYFDHTGRWLLLSVVDAVNNSLGYSDLCPYIGCRTQKRFMNMRYVGLLKEGDYGLMSVFLFSRFVVGAIVWFGIIIASFYWTRHLDSGLLITVLFVAIIVVLSYNGNYMPRVRTAYEPVMFIVSTVGWFIVLSRLSLHVKEEIV